MKEHLPDWIGGFITGDQQQLVGLLGLATLVVLAYLLRIPLRSWQEKRRIRRAVKRLGARVMRDVNLPDGMGGAINIDYLVLAADAIRVIGVKRYDGMIFGSANTAMSGPRRSTAGATGFRTPIFISHSNSAPSEAS
jgi:hypothetical protein